MKTIYVGDDEWVVASLESRGWSVAGDYSVRPVNAILDLRGREDPDDIMRRHEELCIDCAVVAIVDDGSSRLAAHLSTLGARILPNSLLAARDSHAQRLLVHTLEQASLTRSKIPIDVERKVYELLGLHALAQAVSTSLNAETVATRALEVLLGLIPHSSIAIYIADPRPTLSGDLAPSKSGTLQWIRIASKDGVTEFPREIEHRLIAPTIETNEASWLEDDDPLARLLCEGRPNTQAVVMPIHGTAGTIGALTLCYRQGRDEMLERRNVLSSVAVQLGTALENAWLFEEIGVAYRSLQQTQDQLVRAEKFAAVGLLAAEIAHEINNPAAFIITNLSVMEEYVETVASFHRALRGFLDESGAIERHEFESLVAEHEIEFLDEDLEALVRRSLVGLERIHQIVLDLRYFAREEGGRSTRVSLESLLESVVSIVRHEAKYKADIVLEVASLPPITSDANRLSQVFLNLLLNSVQAIEERPRDSHTISVSGEVAGDRVRIYFADDGPGIDESHREHVFEPFFTTKEPGSGTGLGLSISRDIVRSLGGELDLVDSNEGATFCVTLPIEAPEAP